MNNDREERKRYRLIEKEIESHHFRESSLPKEEKKEKGRNL